MRGSAISSGNMQRCAALTRICAVIAGKPSF